jgi:hypothetical protein
MTAILAALALAAGADPAPRECTIALVVTKAEPGAPRSQRERVVGEPRVVTRVGRPAYFRLGQVQLDTPGVTGPGALPPGDAAELEVLPVRLADGRVRLEMRVAGADERGAEWAWEAPAGAKRSFRVETATGVLRVEVVAAGRETVGRR